MLLDTIIDAIQGNAINIWSILAQVVSLLVIIFLILPFHEFAHAFVAYKLGDPTPKYEKRLTINPLASVDPIGSLALILFGFGWAKPVGVNPRNFKNPKRGMAIVALAGPLANLLAALVGTIAYIAVALSTSTSMLMGFLSIFLGSYISINILLAVFNLIPFPPLDGSRIIAAFLTDRAAHKYYAYQRYFYMIFFVLMLSGALTTPLSYAQNFFINIIFDIAYIPFKLFGML